MMSRCYFIKKLNYHEHPGAVDEIMLLQRFIPEYLREKKDCIEANLINERNINMCIMDGYGSIFFYVLALPQTRQLVDEFLGDDLLMLVDEGRYYIDQVVARDDVRNRFQFLVRIVRAVFEEANSMGFYKFSMHALCENGIDRIATRVFRDCVYMRRRVTLSRYGNKDYIYMEANYGL